MAGGGLALHPANARHRARPMRIQAAWLPGPCIDAHPASLLRPQDALRDRNRGMDRTRHHEARASLGAAVSTDPMDDPGLAFRLYGVAAVARTARGPLMLRGPGLPLHSARKRRSGRGEPPVGRFALWHDPAHRHMPGTLGCSSTRTFTWTAMAIASTRP
jgi:hypothetical protein